MNAEARYTVDRHNPERSTGTRTEAGKRRMFCNAVTRGRDCTAPLLPEWELPVSRDGIKGAEK